MALTFKVYRLGLTFPGGGNAVMAKSVEENVELVSMSDLEKVLEREDGGFRLGNVSAVVRGLDEGYFDGADDPNAPFVFEVADGATAIFHGPVSPTSIVRDEATGYFSFDVLSWEAMLAMVGSVPARSVYEANVRAVDFFNFVRVHFPAADYANVNVGDVVIGESGAGEFREPIVSKSALGDTSFYVSIVPPPSRQMIDPFDPAGVSWIQTPLVWTLPTVESRLLMERLEPNGSSQSGFPIWVPEGGEKVFVEFLDGTQVIESTRVLKVEFDNSDPLNIVADLWLDSADFDGDVVSSNGGPTGTFLFDFIGIRSIAGVIPAKNVRILGSDIYGAEVVNSTTVPFFQVEDIVDAMLFLGENNEPTESFGRPLGILPNVIRNVERDPFLTPLVRGFLDVGIELPDRPIEALRLLQRTSEFHVKFVPIIDSGLPRVDVKLIPRQTVGTETPVNLTKVIRRWHTRVTPEKVTAVVVKANEDYRKPESEKEFVGVWWIDENGDTPDDVAASGEPPATHPLRYLTVPEGPGVLEIEVAVQPAYESDYDFLGGGKPIANDNVLKLIAQSAYDYYAKAGQRFEATLRVNYATDLLANRYTVDESGFNKTVFITRSVTTIKDNQYSTTVEGIVEPVVTPGTGATPVAVISGVLNYPDTGSGATVALSGTQSQNPSGEPLSFAWRRRERVAGVWGAWSGTISTTPFVNEVRVAGVYEYELRVWYDDGVVHEDFDYEVVSISAVSDIPGGGNTTEVRFFPFERADAADQEGNLMFDPDSGDGDGNIKGLQLNYEGTNASWGTIMDTFNSPEIDAEFSSLTIPNASSFGNALTVEGPLLVNTSDNGTDRLQVDGSVGITSALTGLLRFTASGAATVRALGTQITIEQTGDTLGDTFLMLANRSGHNGMKLTTTGPELTDLMFDAPSVVDGYIRYEGRSGTAKFGARAFHFSVQATPDDPDFAVAVGKVGANRMIVGTWTDDDATKVFQVTGHSRFKGNLYARTLTIGDADDSDFSALVSGGYFRLDSYAMPLYLNSLSDEAVFLGDDSLLGSQAFVGGFGGGGWRIQEQAGYVGWTGTLDNLFVRGSLTVYELIINQIRATNGSLFVSSAARVKQVDTLGGGNYTLHLEGEDSGDTGYIHPFALDDLLIAQRRDAGATTGSGIFIYRSFVQVTAVVDNDTVQVSLLGGSTAPQQGFDYVRFGNTSDTNRQGHIYLTADDASAPFIGIRDGVSSLAGWADPSKEKVRIGRLDGRSPFAGETDALYGFIAGDTTALQVSITPQDSLGAGTGGMEFWAGATRRGFVRSDEFFFSTATTGAYMSYNNTTGAQIGFGGNARVQIEGDGITVWDEDDIASLRVEAAFVRVGPPDDDRVVVDTTGVKLYNGASLNIATFAAVTTIGDTTNAHTRIDSTTVQIKSIVSESLTTIASFGETTTVGATTGAHVSITAGALQIKDGSTVLLNADGTKVSLGDTVSNREVTMDSSTRSFYVRNTVSGLKFVEMGDFDVSADNAITNENSDVANRTFVTGAPSSPPNSWGLVNVTGTQTFTSNAGAYAEAAGTVNNGATGNVYIWQKLTGSALSKVQGKYVEFEATTAGVSAPDWPYPSVEVWVSTGATTDPTGNPGAPYTMVCRTQGTGVLKTSGLIPSNATAILLILRAYGTNDTGSNQTFQHRFSGLSWGYYQPLTQLGRNGLMIFRSPYDKIVLSEGSAVVKFTQLTVQTHKIANPSDSASTTWHFEKSIGGELELHYGGVRKGRWNQSTGAYTQG